MECFICNRKLKLVEQMIGTCKCGNMYCKKHRTPSMNTDDKNYHFCSFDHKNDNKNMIRQNNPVVENKFIFL